MKKRIFEIWNKIPAIVRAILVGMIIQIIGVIPLFILISKNIEIMPQFPLASVIGLLYIWIFWRFVSGKKGPFSPSIFRVNLSRTNKMEPKVKKWAYISGIPFTITLFSFSILGFLLTEMPLNQVQILSSLKSIPIWTSISLIFLVAFVTGVVEETAFRGYMQRIIEEKHSPVMAIIIVSLVFTIVHFMPLPVWPIFILVSIGWGYLAYFSGSILPGIIFHTLVDFVGFIWGMVYIDQLKEILEYNVFIDGANNLFIALMIIGILFGIATIFSLNKLKNEMALTKK